jgi:hypothetical protein
MSTDASSGTVTVVFSGSEESLTYPDVQAWEEGRYLVVAGAQGVIARFEIRDLKHWYTDPT